MSHDDDGGKVIQYQAADMVSYSGRTQHCLQLVTMIDTCISNNDAKNSVNKHNMNATK